MPIPPGWELPDEIKARLGEKAGRQRSMVADDHLLLVLHKVPEAGQLEREGVYFWRSPSGDWRFSGGGPGLFVLRQHLEAYGAAVQELERHYDTASGASDYFRILEAVVPLHRAARNQHTALQTARESLPDVRELITLRDEAGDIERASELIATDAKNALDYSLAKQAEEQSRLSDELTRVAHRMNLLAALFLPLTAVTSVFGMNLPSGLEKASRSLFWSIIVFGVLLGAAFLGVIVGRRGTKTK